MHVIMNEIRCAMVSVLLTAMMHEVVQGVCSEVSPLPVDLGRMDSVHCTMLH